MKLSQPRPVVSPFPPAPFSMAARPFFAAFIAMVVLTMSARAASETWTGSTSGTWGSTGNWTNSTVPGVSDTATFNSSSANTQVTLSAATPISSITFDTSSVAAYTIGTTSGPTLDLASGGTIQTTSTVANIETVNAPISLGGNYTFTSGSSATADVLNFGGTIGASASATLTLNGSNTGANTIAGIISNDSTTLKTAIDKEGSGHWILSGTNTFTGGITVGGGTLTLSGANAANTVTLTNSGATLDVEVNNGVVFNNLSGVAGSVITNNSSANNKINLAESTGTTTTFAGNITNGTGTISVSESGPGNLYLTGASTFTGGYTTTDTTATFVAGASLANVTNATIISSLGNSGSTSALGYGAIDIESTGVLIYDTSGTNAGTTSKTVSYGNSGGTNVEIDNDSSSSTASLTLSSIVGTAQNNTSTQNLYLGGTNTGTNNIASALANGGGTTSDAGGNTTVIGKVDGGTWELSGASTYGGGTNIQAGTLILGSSTVVTSTLTTGPLGTGVGAFANGVLTGANFNGATVSSGAVLDLNGQTISQAIVLNGTGLSSAGALINSSSTAATISGGSLTGLQLSSGGSGYSSAPSLSFSGGGGTGATGTVTLGLTSASATVANGGSGYTNGSAVTITGGGGSGAKATLNVTGGVITGITITAAGSGYTSAPTFSVTGGTGGSLTGNATNFTITGLTITNAGSGYTTAPTVTVGGSGGASVTAYDSGVILGSSSSVGGVGGITINGPVTEQASGYSLTKVGTNTVTLGGADTFNGGLIIDSGAVSVASLATIGTAQPLGEGALTLAGTSATAPGILQYTGGTGTLTQALTVTSGDYGTLVNTGGGTLSVTGTLTKSGSVLIFGGGVFNVSGQITSTGTASFNSDLEIENGSTVTLTNANNNYYGPTYVLGGSSLSSGTTTLIDGVTNALPTNTVLTLGASTDGFVTNIYSLGGYNQSIAALDSAGTDTDYVTDSGGATNTLTLSGANGNNGTFGGIIQDGTGTLSLAVTGGTQTLTGANTYSGGTAISGGVLYANSTGATVSSTGAGTVSVASGGTLAGTGAIRPTLSSGYGVSVASGGNITPGGVQPTANYNYTANGGAGPTNPANGNLTLDPTHITGGKLLSVAPTLSLTAPALTFALGSGGSSSQIDVAGSAANIINFNAGGTGSTSSVISINDLVGASLNLNSEYVLIAGNGNTTFENNGSTLTLGATVAGLGQQILGGVTLLTANTNGNFFSSWYSGSQLYLNGDDIEVDVVPEPSTWVMMLGGLGVLVLWQRRRENRG